MTKTHRVFICRGCKQPIPGAVYERATPPETIFCSDDCKQRYTTAEAKKAEKRMPTREWRKMNRERLLRERTVYEIRFAKRLKAVGISFEEQAICGRYFADFLLPHGVIVELDGKDHYTKEGILRDQRRDANLIRHGYTIIRIPNSDVSSVSLKPLTGPPDRTQPIRRYTRKTPNTRKTRRRQVDKLVKKLILLSQEDFERVVAAWTEALRSLPEPKSAKPGAAAALAGFAQLHGL
jgi:very-short-patch-repair endonuclease